MYLGFLTVSLGDMPLAEKAEWAAANGFSSLEVACWPAASDRDYSSNDIDVAALDRKKAEKIKRFMKDCGLTISSLAYYDNNLHRNPEKKAFVNNHVKKCIDAAEMLETTMVGTFTGRNIDKSVNDNFDDFEQTFTDLTAYADKRNIRLIIENCVMEGWQVQGLPGTISFTPELWKEMFRRVPAMNFGLNFDPSHLLVQLIDYISVIPEFAGRIFHVHAKDSEVFADRLKRYGVFDRQLETGDDSGGYWRYRMPGLGQIDWVKFIGALKLEGYDGVLSIEHEDPLFEGSREKVKEGLSLGMKYLEKLI